MRAILIDPVNKAVTEVEYAGDDLRASNGAYALMNCELVELVRLNPDYTNDDMFVDEEGLYKDSLHMFTTTMDPYKRPLCGRALVIGHEDEEGGSTPATMDVPAVIASIEWLGRIR